MGVLLGHDYVFLVTKLDNFGPYLRVYANSIVLTNNLTLPSIDIKDFGTLFESYYKNQQ